MSIAGVTASGMVLMVLLLDRYKQIKIGKNTGINKRFGKKNYKKSKKEKF